MVLIRKGGSSAWVLEGSSTSGRIIGSNRPPETSSGQNSYRSELAVLYGILTMLSTICSLYQLMSGNITIACNKFFALNNSLEEFRSPKISDAEHDLIYTIKHGITSLPISYQIHHVKGHQDDVLPQKDLDRWSLLNIEKDKLVKSAVNNWAESQYNQQIDGEPSPVWSNDVKLANDLDSKLYEIFHFKVMEEYWIKRHKFPEHQTSNIHWEALEKAMKAVPLAKRTFITKHATGMCGVGKFVKLWRGRDTAACPQ
jgi:hypothetical protein